MPNPKRAYTYSITTKDGKRHDTRVSNIENYGIQSYVDAYPGATIHMRDKEGKDYDIPLEHYEYARSQGFRPFTTEYPVKEENNIRPRVETRQGPAQDVNPKAESDTGGTRVKSAKVPMTEMQKRGYMMELASSAANTRGSGEASVQRLRNQAEYTGKSIGRYGQAVETAPRFNVRTGELEKTYLTPQGVRTSSRGAAEMAAANSREAFDNSIEGQLRMAEERRGELERQLHARGQEIEAERKSGEQSMGLLGRLMSAGNDMARGGVGASGTVNTLTNSGRYTDERYIQLEEAIRQTDDLITTLRRQRDRENGEDVGILRTLRDEGANLLYYLDPNAQSRSARAMLSANDNPELESAQILLGQSLLSQQAHANYDTSENNRSRWTRIAVQSLPFMLDMISSNWATGAFRGGAKLATKATLRAFGKEAVEQMARQGFKSYVKANGVRGLGRAAGNWTIKQLGNSADDFMRGAFVSNATQTGKTALGITEQKLGGIEYNENNGKLEYEDDGTWSDAVWQGGMDAAIESMSEFSGEHWEGALKKLTSSAAGLLGLRRLSKILGAANSRSLGRINSTMQRAFRKAGINGYLGEVGEEYYGQLWRTMLGLDSAYQQNPDGTRTNLFGTGQFHGDIWGGMALSIGMMKAVGTPVSAANYLSMRHDVNKASAIAGEALTPEVWNPLRETIDNTTNDDMGAFVMNFVRDGEFTQEEKSAVMDYIERVMYLRGANLADVARSRGGELDPFNLQLGQDYMAGYGLDSDEQMQDARNAYVMMRQDLLSRIPPETLARIEQDPAASGEIQDEQTRRMAAVYLRSKNVYDGMIKRVQDDIDTRVAQTGAMIDSRVNSDTGTIIPVTMKSQDANGNSRQAYVTSGNLIKLEDGTGIDIGKSSGSITVRYADTSELEMVSPGAILSVSEPLSPEHEKSEAERNIRLDYAQRLADRIDGRVSFIPGGTFVMTSQEGKQKAVTIVADENGSIENENGEINLTVDGGKTIFHLTKEEIQGLQDITNQIRARERMHEVQEQDQPEIPVRNYETGDIQLIGADGHAIEAQIIEVGDETNGELGRYLVQTDGSIEGKAVVDWYSREELDGLTGRVQETAQAEQTQQAGTEAGEITEGTDEVIPAQDIASQEVTLPVGEENLPVGESELPVREGSMPEGSSTPSAYERIPKDEQGQPVYEQADPDTAWDAIVEQAGGDEAMAQSVADSMVADKEAELKKVEKAKPKGGATIAEKIAAERERKNAVEQAKANLALWQKIAQTSQRRRQTALAEQSRQAAEAARLRREQEEQERAAREEAERIRREALNGVPDFVDDTPQDARARGYRRVNGEKVDRQQSIPTRQGKEVQVKFDDKNIPTGHVALIDASQLQPSHINGHRNPAHFIDEAQPKERNDDASVMSARRIAANIRPEEITSSVTAYTGAPTVNTRGEVIQGNNRSAALREMWASYPEQAGKYKQYLKEHAAIFGLTPEDVEAMQQPVLVNMIDVPDEAAITLGQFVAQDTESGGSERIKPKNLVQRMGHDIGTFANRLLASPDEEASFSELVDSNGTDVLKWMQQKGYITPTQYNSAFDSKGNLTAEAKNDLKGIMFQNIFKNGNTHLEEMFGMLPAKAQKAILATAYRDYDSPNAERLNAEIQDSISAYYALSQNSDFANAKNYKEARMAVEAWKRQYALDDVTGESYLPLERYSNFALLLATMYKGQTQTFIQNTFNHIFDLVQGTQETTLFEEPDNTPRTLVEAINETLSNLSEELLLNGKFEYNGQRRNNVLAGSDTTGQQRGQGSPGSSQAGGRAEDGTETSNGNRRTEISGKQGQIEGRNDNQLERDSSPKQEEYTLSSKRSGNGEPFYQDADGNIDLVDIPQKVFDEIGYSKAPFRLTPSMILHVLNGHGKELGISTVEETLHFVLDVMNHFDHVRLGYDGALIFSIENGRKRIGKRAVTILINSDNGKFYGLKTSGYETVNGLSKRPLLWERGAENVSSTTDAASASVSTGKSPLSGEQSGSASHQIKSLSNSKLLEETSEPTNSRTDVDSNLNGVSDDTATQHSSDVSDNKDTDKSAVAQTIGEKVAQAEAETDQNPTEAQKEAGNYKKGHVRIGQFDITVENPKGSVRRGTDQNGNPWETTMHNTYGYIRGTEGVDGDHIDVFLTNDIDGWNGRRVYVVDQYNEDGTFDEHKVMLGFNDEDDARNAYLSNYSEDWAKNRKIIMTSTNLEDFEKWIDSSHRKTKPFAEYKSVQNTDVRPVSGYNIEQRYHKKKDTYIYAVKFTEQMPREQFLSLKKRVKDFGGYYSSYGKGGFIFETEEAGRKFAEAVLDPSGEKLDDNKPLSLVDMQQSSEPVMRQVDVEGLMQAINENGEAKLSDHFVMGRPGLTEKATSRQTDTQTQETEQQPQQSDNNDYGANNKLVSRDRYEELKKRMRQKLGGQLNMGIDPKILAIGTEMAAFHIEAGARKFADYARHMIDDLGDAIRPYLKSFYNGVRDLPEVQEAGYVDDMTPYDEVRTFDVANFDKAQGDAMATAEMVVAEQEANRQANEAKEKLTNQRNEQRRQGNEQRTADTEAVADEAETTESEAESRIEAATDEKEVNEAVRKVDEQLDKVNRQLALLGYYEAEPVESDFNEAYGYMRNAEKKAVKDANNLANRLVNDLGIDPKMIVDKKGKLRRSIATANIAPIGGDISIHLPLGEKRELYITIQLDKQDGDNLKVMGGMLRIENQNPERGEERYLSSNNFFAENETYPSLLRMVQQLVEHYAPDFAPVSNIKQEASTKVEKDARKQLAEEHNKKQAKERTSGDKKAVSSQSQTPDLFGNIIIEEQPNEKNDEAVQEFQHSTPRSGQGGHAVDTSRPMGEGQRSEAEQPSRRRVDTSSGTDVRYDGERGGRLADVSQGESHRVAKNRHNNHAERGKNYSPTTPKARYDANIAAIRLARELTDSGQQATDTQKEVLRQFSGWGGLGTFFNNERTRGELVELLGDDGFKQAAMSLNSAYYTPASIVDTMWDVVSNLGFKGGRILEGSAGIGNILGLMPMNISDHSDIEAVEVDGLSGMILRLLYPEADVKIQGFENTKVRNGSIDLAITNVPFVTGLHVHDTTGDRDLSRQFGNIHDFCIAKNIRKLREGGIGVFISSSGTLDRSKSLRDWVTNEGNADFIGAFRLNNKTFDGTTATSDIIVVRKRVGGKKSVGSIDLSDTESVRTVEVTVNDNGKDKNKPIVLQYNRYFVEHPENMGGEMALNYERGETFRQESSGLFPTNGINQNERIQQWAETFKDKAVEVPQSQTEEPVDIQTDANGNEIKDGTLVADKDGKISVMYLGKAEPLNVNDKKVKGHAKAECLEDYNRIKRALNAVLEYESTNEIDTGLSPLLKELNDAYDSFKEKYGNLNKNTAISFLRNDIDFPGIQALEKYSEANDKDGKRVEQTEKTSIFKERVVQKEVEPHPTNILDAVKTSVFKTGMIDIPYIAKQLGMSNNEVNAAIVKGGYGFVDPATQTMEVSYKYLSGNVREKLAIAEANNEDGRYDDNIRALKKVMPMDIPAHLIEFTFGSSWVNPKLFQDYVNEKTGVPVTLTNAGGQWNMELPYFVATEKNKSEGVRSKKLGKIVLGTDLMNAAINNRTITVSTTQRTWDGKAETITDKEATQACATKIDDIRSDFKDWARAKMQSDPELAKEIERVYNERFNNYVPVQVTEEFVPERFPGSSTKIKLFPHQSKAAIRATGQPIMLAHEVGTGKTFTLITTAMEMRRLGLARKPMIVVQNATVGQFVASAKELYPKAKVLTIADNERNEEGRKRFYAKIKYNDCDMIVVPQSVFERIPDSEERQMDFINDRIEEKQHVLEQMQELDPKSVIARNAKRELDSLQTELADISEKKRKRDEKRAAKTRQNAAAKAQEQLDRATDDVENFDDMEIDAVLVDEAHEYKHLGFSTAMQRGVKGVDPSYSKKSAGVYLKTRAVMDKSGGKNVVFATGTPISNTAAEIWTFMRYLMPKHTMEEYGIYYFDDFVRNFGNLTQMLEFTTSGKFRENNRFAGYVNIPELMRIWSGVADTVLTSETNLKDKLPETVEGGQKATDIYLPQSASLRSIMKAVRAELERFDNMTGKEKKENSAIPLVMYGIAKAAAIDPRLVMSDAADEPVSKTNRAVEETLKSLEATNAYNGTVAIFCDTYQNKQTGFNIYEEIKRKLVERGVPENQIVIMRSGMSVNKKAEIFDKVNSGDVRVIMGSTFTLGTGVNIQERLNTIIHLDAPNRPMDYTQRNGRILRQGNLHKQWGIPVKILRFGVEDSLDITAYQRLKTKGAIADSVMEGKKFLNNNQTDRTLEEQEDVFGDTVAQLSGSEYALLKNQAERDFRKYNDKKKQYEADQIYVHNAIPRYEGQIRASKERLNRQRKALSAVEKAYPNGNVGEISIGQNRLSGPQAIGSYIKDVVNKKQAETEEKVRKGAQGTKARTSYTLKAGPFTFTISTEYSKDTDFQNGNLFPVVHRNMTYSCETLGLSKVPVQRASFKNAVDDIINNVLSGADMRERIETETAAIEHNSSELAQLKEREGKPFENEKELEEARRKVEDYTTKMREEMESKEKKYAEMDAQTESADLRSLSGAEEAEEEGDTLYREVDSDLEEANERFNEKLDDLKEETAERERQRMTQRVQELAEKLHLDNVDIVTDASTLQGRRAKAKGFYSRGTGRITIVIPNHTSVYDVEQTLLHEAVAHYGLRQLFGEHFDTFLDNVSQNADKDVRRRITELARERNWYFRTATEEYLASLAENTNFDNTDASWWQKIKELFLRMLHKIGFEDFSGVTLSDNELRYILWRSYENLAEPGRYRSILGEAADVAKQYELKVGNFAPTAAIGGQVAESANSVKAERIRKLRESKPVDITGEEYRGKYELNRDSAQKYVLDNLRGEYTIKDTGEKVNLSKVGAKKVTSHSMGNEAHLKSIAAIPQLISNAIFIEERLPYKEGAQYDSYRYYVTGLKINGEDYTVRMTIGVKNGKYYYDHYLTNIEKGNLIEIAQGFTPTEDAPNPSYAGYKDKVLLSILKENEEENLLYRQGTDENMDEGDGTSPLSGHTIQAWDRLAGSLKFQLTETAFDYLNAVDKFQKLIAEHSGKTVKDFENAYDALTFLSSRNREEMDMFDSFFVKPLNEAIVALTGKADSRRNWKWDRGPLRELVMYVEAKHGTERNRQMAVEAVSREDKENASSIMQAWSEAKKRINGQDGLSWTEKQAQLDESAKSLGADVAQDYSGLSSVFGNTEQYPEGWNDAARAYVTQYEDSHGQDKTSALWHAINNATGFTLQKQYETGLVSREYMERQRERFENYIPLRGFENDTAGDVYNYIGQDYYPGGNPVKTAHGRTSEPGNPFGSILNTAYASISSGNKNVAKTAFYALVMNHDTGGLAVPRRAWKVRYADLKSNPELERIVASPKLDNEEEIPEWIEAVPRIPENGTPEEVVRVLGEFESVMNKYSEEGATEPIWKKSQIAYRTLYKERDQHEIPLYIAGDKYVITITGNPRVAQAVNGLLNPNSGNENKWLEFAKKVQRFMAGAFTAKNAAFSLANLSRDTIYANNQIFIRENIRYWLRFTKNQKAGFGDYPQIMRRLYKYRSGKLDMNDKTERLFAEFMRNGGATGYTFVNTQEEYAKELEKKLRQLSKGRPDWYTPNGAVNLAFDCIEFAGQSAELVNRFAAYRTSREMGRSVSRSIRDAKEITVNFNRKGAGRKTLSDKNAWYVNLAASTSEYGLDFMLFWNANMQGKYRFFKNLREHPVKTGVTMIGNSMLISAVMLPLLNNIVLPALYSMFGSGDDDGDKDRDDAANDYFNSLTDYERTRNICIRLPKENWLKIPISPDMAPWFTIGDAVGGQISGQRDIKASDVVHSMVDAASPLSINWSYKGYARALNVLPTVTQPIAQNMMNVNFMGNPIRKSPFTTKQGKNPQYTMVYRNASPTLVELSRLSNRLTGGEDDKSSGEADWNPSMVQNLISGYTGGYGTTFLSLADWIVGTSKGEKQAVTFSKMPFVSRFAISGNKDVRLQRINSRFYEVRDFVMDFEFDRDRYLKRIAEGQKEHDSMKVAEGMSLYNALIHSHRAAKYNRLAKIKGAVDTYEKYLKEFPDDEATRNLLYQTKSIGIDVLREEEEENPGARK